MNWLERKAADMAIGRVRSKLMAQGWMGKTGAVGVALGAIGAAIVDFSNGTMTTERALGYWSALSGALALFGIRRAVGGQASPLLK